MYTTKSGLMVRNIGASDEKRLSEEEFHRQTKSIMASFERFHFEFGSITRDHFIKSIRNRIYHLAKINYRKPKDVAYILNKMGFRTACGAQWSPRLAYFLLNLVFEKKPN